MLVSSILLFVAVLLITGIVVGLVIPNFNHEKRYAVQAAHLAMTHAELRRVRKDPVSLFVSNQLQKHIPQFIGGRFRSMYLMLNKENTFEEELGDIAVKSLVACIPFIVVPFIFGIPALLLLLPIVGLVFFLAQLYEIPKLYKKRQDEIIKDLPQLISKMMIALETGKSFVTTIQRLEETSGPRMRKMLARLNANLQIMKLSDAIDLFANEIDIPVMREFASAVKIGVNSGYEEAREYFQSIKGDLSKIRLASLKELTRSKPEKVKFLYVLVAAHAFAAVIIAFFAIFSNIKTL